MKNICTLLHILFFVKFSNTLTVSSGNHNFKNRFRFPSKNKIYSSQNELMSTHLSFNHTN